MQDALDGYPFEGRFLDVGDGIRMHFLDEGEGPLVLMVHGNPTWSYAWRSLVQALRGDFRVIVPDHIGMGRSDKPGDDAYPYTLERRITDLERLIGEVAPEGDVRLVAHDWGGMIGMGFATRHAARIERLVLMNTAAFPLPPEARVPFALHLARSPLGGVLVRGLNAFARGAASRCVVRAPLSRAVRDGYLAPYDTPANRIAVHRFVQDIPLDPSHPTWPTVVAVDEGLAQFRATPTLLLWGMQDFVFTPPFLDAWTRRLPDAEVVRYADAGHYVFEDEAEDVEARVQAFLGARS